jgi:hypothetical protein
MKKKLFSIVILFCLSLIAFSNRPLTKSNVVVHEVNAPPTLVNGVYWLCCENGHLNLYNLLGVLVGTGDDCGDITNQCYKVVLHDSPSQLKGNPTVPSGDYILSLLNTCRPTTGSEHSGTFGEGPTYHFLRGDIHW